MAWLAGMVWHGCVYIYTHIVHVILHISCLIFFFFFFIRMHLVQKLICSCWCSTACAILCLVFCNAPPPWKSSVIQAQALHAWAGCHNVSQHVLTPLAKGTLQTLQMSKLSLPTWRCGAVDINLLHTSCHTFWKCSVFPLCHLLLTVLYLWACVKAYLVRVCLLQYNSVSWWTKYQSGLFFFFFFSITGSACCCTHHHGINCLEQTLCSRISSLNMTEHGVQVNTPAATFS